MSGKRPAFNAGRSIPRQAAPSAANDDKYDTLVAAHSALIGDLGTAITAELRKLAGPPPG